MAWDTIRSDAAQRDAQRHLAEGATEWGITKRGPQGQAHEESLACHVAAWAG